MRHNHDTRAGFTLIELMLAMVFVAFILIFMSLTLVQMLRTYDKAVSMKQINQAGRTITEDISRAMRSQLPSSIKTAQVANGLLCIDKTMYYWRPLFTGAPLKTALRNVSADAVSGPLDTGSTMVRKTLKTAATPCDATQAAIPSNFESGSEVTLLSNRSRVIWANAVPSDNGDLVELTFIIGTYDYNEVKTAGQRDLLTSGGGAGDYSNFAITPHREIDGSGTASIMCLAGTPGNYCAFAEFKTVVYVSKDESL